MVSERKRRKALNKVEQGDGHSLKRFRWWQPFSRALYHARFADAEGSVTTWSVSVAMWGESSGDQRARLYRDGIEVAHATLPAVFAVPGGTIEVNASGYGLKRMHFVGDDGRSQQLLPDPASAEGNQWRRRRDLNPTRGQVIT